MITDKEFAAQIIEKAKFARKKSILKKSFIAFSTTFVLVFLVAFSNIISFNNLFSGNYSLNFLRSYISNIGDNYTSLRFLDKENAVLTLENNMYACKINAKTSKKFALTPYAKNGEGEVEKSSFEVTFKDNSATVRGTIDKQQFKSYLTVAEDKNIQRGVWSLFATQSGDMPISENISGAGWILLLENGDAYAGEGEDSVWQTYFLGVGGRIINCYLDSVSGAVVELSSFEYLDDLFDFPVIRQSYYSDAEPYYFYFKRLNDNQLTTFSGAIFNGASATYFAENHSLERQGILNEYDYKWQLLPLKSYDEHIVNQTFSLELNADYTATISIDKTSKKAYGKWYKLRHCVLVVLDKKHRYAGKAFTVYDDSLTLESGEYAIDLDLQNYAVTRIEGNNFHKVGYHIFNYYNLYSQTYIYWGNKWESDKLQANIVYDKHYFISGKYFEDYYNDINIDVFDLPPNYLKDLPNSVNMSVVFRENFVIEVYKDETLDKTIDFELSTDNKGIILSRPINIIVGEKPIKLTYFSISSRGLYCEHISHYGLGGDIIKNVDVTHYKINFKMAL